jgi:hypothetical protein
MGTRPDRDAGLGQRRIAALVDAIGYAEVHESFGNWSLLGAAVARSPERSAFASL